MTCEPGSSSSGETYLIPMRVKKGHALALPTIGATVEGIIPGAKMILQGINVGADGGVSLSLTLSVPWRATPESVSAVINAFKAGVSAEVPA